MPDLITATDTLLLTAVLAYLLGAIPFGVVITRIMGLGDLRQIGSGNIGATNVLRTGNKPAALATLLLDSGKGAIAVLLARALAGQDAALIAGAAAFLGHLYPVWLNFKGGKGVATYIGVLLGVAPLMVLVFAAVWLSVAKLSRYSSLSALVATLVVPVVSYAIGDTKPAILFAIMTLITWIKHKANIQRLLAGTESRIGDKG